MAPESSGGRSLVLVRGAGDLASGVIHRLWKAGYALVALETAAPSAIRRTVSFSEAVYEGSWEVEGLAARLVGGPGEALEFLDLGGGLPVLVDPGLLCLEALRPAALVDAIIAKRNLGTRRGMAGLVLALGPGFVAGVDVDCVIETNRGHDLGRTLWSGSAEADTGRPGELGGVGEGRVIRAEAEGRLEVLEGIGSSVAQGQVIAFIETTNDRLSVYSKIDGVLRGMLRPGYGVSPGLKIADVDPRGKRENCWKISDKARAIGGAVLEALVGEGIYPRGSSKP